MRNDVAITIGAGVAGFALCAYLVSYAMTRHDPVEWQNGDLVFQTTTSLPNQMILDAAASPLTNVGIVAVSNDGDPTVIETGDKVDEVPMSDFVDKGTDGAIAVYRVRNLTPELGVQVVQAARKQLGKPYDVFFDKDSDNIYSAELVRLAFGVVGLTLGQSERLDRLARKRPGFESLFDQQWSNLQECQSHSFDQQQCWAYILKRQLITLASIATDEHVGLIYSDMPSVQALRPE